MNDVAGDEQLRNYKQRVLTSSTRLPSVLVELISSYCPSFEWEKSADERAQEYTSHGLPRDFSFEEYHSELNATTVRKRAYQTWAWMKQRVEYDAEDNEYLALEAWKDVSSAERRRLYDAHRINIRQILSGKVGVSFERFTYSMSSLNDSRARAQKLRAIDERFFRHHVQRVLDVNANVAACGSSRRRRY